VFFSATIAVECSTTLIPWAPHHLDDSQIDCAEFFRITPVGNRVVLDTLAYLQTSESGCLHILDVDKNFVPDFIGADESEIKRARGAHVLPVNNVWSMSAVPPKPAAIVARRRVRYRPKADINRDLMTAAITCSCCCSRLAQPYGLPASVDPAQA
jgi:hypothetical protein